MSTDFEDKKCRLCGHADTENENIFYTRDRYLVKKIAAVFSIWVSPTDPLPKCICPKCFAKVNSTYKSYTQVKKLQTKWLENVAAQEPNNNYIQVLSFIERANMSIKNFIETNYREKLSKDVIENLLISALSGMNEGTAGTVSPNSDANALSNGATDVFETSPIKTEPSASDTDDDEENLSLAKIATNKKMKFTTSHESTETKCNYCALKFENLKELAAHQISHMKLSLPKLFEPKCLDKNFRRGRLISSESQSQQSIRCLNCYLVFNDNKCILEHWLNAECDFYCQICGEEFSQSPKLLREHVTEVHGISYRSLKMQRNLSFLSLPPQQPMLSKPKQKIDSKSIKPKLFIQKMDVNQVLPHIEVSSSTSSPQFLNTHPIKCRICNRYFRNFKACNSHMRAHKPPYAYNDGDQLPDLNTDAYMEPEPRNCETAPPPLTPMPKMNLAQLCANTAPVNGNSVAAADDTTQTTSPAATSSANTSNMSLESPLSKKTEMAAPTDMELETIQLNTSTASSNNFNNHSNNNFPASNIMVKLPPASPNASKATTSTAPRGIRMKFVNRRSDLNGGNAAIKVKSISDLKATPSSVACQLPLASPKELKPVVPSVPTRPPQQVPLNEVKPNQSTTACLPPLYAAFDNLKPAQNVATRPLPPHPASVIVDSLQNQPTPSFNSFEPPIMHNAVLSGSIKDEPMEFI